MRKREKRKEKYLNFEERRKNRIMLIQSTQSLGRKFNFAQIFSMRINEKQEKKVEETRVEEGKAYAKRRIGSYALLSFSYLFI